MSQPYDLVLRQCARGDYQGLWDYVSQRHLSWQSALNNALRTAIHQSDESDESVNAIKRMLELGSDVNFTPVNRYAHCLHKAINKPKIARVIADKCNTYTILEVVLLRKRIPEEVLQILLSQINLTTEDQDSNHGRDAYNRLCNLKKIRFVADIQLIRVMLELVYGWYIIDYDRVLQSCIDPNSVMMVILIGVLLATGLSEDKLGGKYREIMKSSAMLGRLERELLFSRHPNWKCAHLERLSIFEIRWQLSVVPNLPEHANTRLGLDELQKTFSPLRSRFYCKQLLDVARVLILINRSRWLPRLPLEIILYILDYVKMDMYPHKKMR